MKFFSQKQDEYLVKPMKTRGIGNVSNSTLRSLPANGMFRVRLDQKNRFKMPAALIRALKATDFYLVPSQVKSTGHKIIRLFTLDAWQDVTYSMFEGERDAFIMHSHLASLDQAGRMLIPQLIMEQAQIKTSDILMVIKHDNHLRVWREQDFNNVPLPSA